MYANIFILPGPGKGSYSWSVVASLIWPWPMHLDPIWFSIVVDFALYFDKILFTKLFKSYKTFLYFQGNESEISLKSYFSWKKLKVQITCLLFWTCVRWCYLRSSGHSAVALYWSILFYLFLSFLFCLFYPPVSSFWLSNPSLLPFFYLSVVRKFGNEFS